MNPGPVFDRVYAQLKAQVLSGRWAPGAKLEPGTIGDDLGASITPVRDALHRLVGERLIEAPRHDGFWIAALTETQLRGLYRWQGDLLAWAARRPCPARLLPADLAAAPAADMLFAAIGRCAGHPELEIAVHSIGERLAPFRAAEPDVLDGVAQELALLAACVAQADPASLRRSLSAYHRRRQRAAPAILERRHRRSEP